MKPAQLVAMGTGLLCTRKSKNHILHRYYPQDRWPVGIHMWWFVSLVPRPSHHPVFDRLQYAQIEGGAWSILSREWHQCRQKREGSLIARMHFVHALNQELLVVYVWYGNRIIKVYLDINTAYTIQVYTYVRLQWYKPHLLHPLSLKTFFWHSPLCSCMPLQCHSDPLMDQWWAMSGRYL